MTIMHILISQYSDGKYTEERPIKADDRIEFLAADIIDMQYDRLAQVIRIDLDEGTAEDISAQFAEPLAHACRDSDRFTGSEDDFPPIVHAYARETMEDHCIALRHTVRQLSNALA